MPNSNYVAGAAAERNIVRELRNLGYESQRSAASHGVFDVYGVKANSVIFIQSKRGGKPSPGDYKDAVEFSVPDGVIKLVLWFPVGQAPRILYYNRLPDWLTDGGNGTAPRVRWFVGDLPKQSALVVAAKGTHLQSAPAPARTKRTKKAVPGAEATGELPLE